MLESLVTNIAREMPERVAVTDGRRRITYARLEVLSRRICGMLLGAGVEPGDRVALYLPRSIEAVAAIHGTLRAGAAYVPLDPEQPPERNRRILASCQPAAILSRSDFSIPETATGPVRKLDIDTIESSKSMPDDPTRPAKPDDPAYILYTSGSTGTPKGVVISRRAAEAFIRWAHAAFDLRPDDRFAAFAPFQFDLSVFDLFNSALCGGTLHLVHRNLVLLPKKLLTYINENGITVWYSVPWVPAQAVAFGRPERFDFNTLRLLLFAGEIFPPGELEKAMHHFRHAEFYNLFGPTETNVCLYYPVPRDRRIREPVPAGRPVTPDKIYIVDEDLTPVPDGVAGELIVSGGTIMDGYWNEPELTRRTLLTHLPGIGPGRYVRTGDRVRLDSDGNVRFLGRIDDQIKRRGYRIEPGEIEAAALKHPAVNACAVVGIHRNGATLVRMVAVLNTPVAAAELKAFLAKNCPDYMLPDEILFRDRLPRNRNGKIDRRKLRDL